MNISDDYIRIRIETELKKEFQHIAQLKNPALGKNAMSAVLRQIIIKYVEENKKWTVVVFIESQ